MKTVGEKLESWALAQKDPREQDVFGRSAFNRYYYAVFLLVREMLVEFEPERGKTQHASLPEYLKDTMRKRLKKKLEKSRKLGLITHGDESKLIEKYSESAANLSELLKLANDARKTADYEPEVYIAKSGNVISLGQHKLGSAKTWPGRASAYCKTIRSVWRDAGFV